jgi:hypothetical protein
MSTKWAVTAAAERVVLGEQRRGEITFTVTNPDTAADRAVFDAVAGEGADTSWFSVEEPQRLVRGGASVSYVMKVAVPADAPPGTYEVQGLVYSADSAPEESSVLGPRVKLEVPSDEKPPPRRWPWWWFAVAGLVVVVLVVVVGLVVAGGDAGPAEAQPTPTPAETAPPGEAVMPDVLGMSERDALVALAERQIAVRPILYRHDPERLNTVLAQSVDPGDIVEPGLGVNLEVAVELVAPLLTAPTGVVHVPVGEQAPELVWDPGRSLARSWRVTIFYERCALQHTIVTQTAFTINCEFAGPALVHDAERPSLIPEMPMPSRSVVVGLPYVTGWYRWHVEPLDDFNNPGPRSEWGYFGIIRDPQ